MFLDLFQGNLEKAVFVKVEGKRGFDASVRYSAVKEDCCVVEKEEQRNFLEIIPVFHGIKFRSHDPSKTAARQSIVKPARKYHTSARNAAAAALVCREPRQGDQRSRQRSLQLHRTSRQKSCPGQGQLDRDT